MSLMSSSVELRALIVILLQFPVQKDNFVQCLPIESHRPTLLDPVESVCKSRGS